MATIGGSNLLPVIYATLGYTAVFLYVAVVLAAAGILLMTMGERTTRRSLEEIEKPTARPPSLPPIPTGSATRPATPRRTPAEGRAGHRFAGRPVQLMNRSCNALIPRVQRRLSRLSHPIGGEADRWGGPT